MVKRLRKQSGSQAIRDRIRQSIDDRCQSQSGLDLVKYGTLDLM
jgi:hypothetical protein